MSKADLYEAASDAPPPPEGAILVSARDDRGLDELRAAVQDALGVVARVTGVAREAT